MRLRSLLLPSCRLMVNRLPFMILAEASTVKYKPIPSSMVHAQIISIANATKYSVVMVNKYPKGLFRSNGDLCNGYGNSFRGYYR